MIRYFDSKEKLKKLFKGFKFLRVDDCGSNVLGANHYMWVVTGFKGGMNLRKFSMFNHCRNIAKPS